MTDASARYCAFLERASADNLHELADLATPDVRFKDPFNDVVGVENMTLVFTDLFENVDNIRFTVADHLVDKQTAFISWTLTGVLRGQPWRVEGSSKLSFNPEGRLTEHVDYWDAASCLYEHFPVIGWLLRALRRRLRIDPSDR